MTKWCRYCQQDRKASAFAKRRASPDGLSYRCRECDRAYRASRPATHLKRLRQQRYEKHRDLERRLALEYHQRNRALQIEKHAAYMLANADGMRAYRKRTIAQSNARSAAYRAALVQRTPLWLTKDHYAEMAMVFVRSNQLTKRTGVQHHVDHQIPLRGKLVSGLHVPWNLQVLPARDNLSKGNRVHS